MVLPETRVPGLPYRPVALVPSRDGGDRVGNLSAPGGVPAEPPATGKLELALAGPFPRRRALSLRLSPGDAQLSFPRGPLRDPAGESRRETGPAGVVAVSSVRRLGQRPPGGFVGRCQSCGMAHRGGDRSPSVRIPEPISPTLDCPDFSFGSAPESGRMAPADGPNRDPENRGLGPCPQPGMVSASMARLSSVLCQCRPRAAGFAAPGWRLDHESAWREAPTRARGCGGPSGRKNR